MVERQKKCGRIVPFLREKFYAIEIAGRLGINTDHAVNYKYDSKETVQDMRFRRFRDTMLGR